MTKYGVILTILCALDLISTAFGIQAGIIEEANPLMAYFLNFGGLKGLIIAKICLNGFCIIFLEIAYKYLLPKEKMRIYYLIAIYSFASAYVVVFIYLNLI